MNARQAPPEALVSTTAPAAVFKRERLRLGDVLVQQHLISQDQLKQALEQQSATGKKLGRLLIEAGVISEETLAHGLARQLRVPMVNLKSFPVKSETVRLLSESPARRHRALVLEDKGEYLLVGFVDPLDLTAYDELARLLRRQIRIAVVAESQLLPVLDRHYRRTEEISGLAKALEKDIGDAVDFGTLQAAVGQEGAPVVRLLQSVFEDAMQVGASDVHIEPQENGLAIRSRIDGVLQTQNQADKRIAAPLAQRIERALLNRTQDLEEASAKLRAPFCNAETATNEDASRFEIAALSLEFGEPGQGIREHFGHLGARVFTAGSRGANEPVEQPNRFIDLRVRLGKIDLKVHGAGFR